MKKTILIFATILLTTLVACSNEQQPEETTTAATEVQTSADHNAAAPPPDANALPALTMQDINGKPVNLQNFKGKKVFVNLWASWCPPCRREMPSIEKLYQSVDTNQVAFVMLSLDDEFEKGKKYVTSNKISLPIYYPGEYLPALFNVQGIPATFIFNENGELIKRVDGSDDYNTAYYKNLLQ